MLCERLCLTLVKYCRNPIKVKVIERKRKFNVKKRKNWIKKNRNWWEKKGNLKKYIIIKINIRRTIIIIRYLRIKNERGISVDLINLRWIKY